MSSLKVLYVSVEVEPFAKVGGLADVAGSLPVALQEMGHDVKIAMPAYGKVLHDGFKVRTVTDKLPVEMNSWNTITGSLHETELDGVPVWLLGGKHYFDGIHRSEDVYSPGCDAYLFFAAAILKACESQGWIPDVIHCNDWHTGFLPVLLREKGGEAWKKTASVYSIHNLAYQGEFGPDILDLVGLPRSLFNMHQLETFGSVNFLKAGCVYADQVNTVSPTYSREIQTPEYGVRLWGLMGDLAKLGRLHGILNGINVKQFDPATDPHIASHFSAEDLSGKAACKEALQRELNLPVDPEVPVYGIVSRLSNQKGFDILIRQAYGMLSLPAQLVVVAVGDPWAANELRQLEADWPDRVRFVERFDPPFAQKVYAGSDFFLMPSAFEPCGLGQMIAMRYGTIPVVRRTGGLCDTVFENENGFTFDHSGGRELYEAIRRSSEVFKDRARIEQLRKKGMAGDYTWASRAAEYVAMYQQGVDGRRLESVVSSARS